MFLKEISVDPLACCLQKSLDQIHFSQCTDCQLWLQRAEKRIFLTFVSVCVDFEFRGEKKPLTSRNYTKNSVIVWYGKVMDKQL